MTDKEYKYQLERVQMYEDMQEKLKSYRSNLIKVEKADKWYIQNDKGDFILKDLTPKDRYDLKTYYETLIRKIKVDRYTL